MGEVRESSDGSLCTTVQPQVHLVVFSEPDRVGIVGCQRVQAGSMATGTALRGSSPCPVARRDCTFEREGGNLILVAQDERSLHLVPTDVPPVPGSPHGPTHEIWEDALTQAGGQLRSLPRLGEHNLAAWKLSVPGT